MHSRNASGIDFDQSTLQGPRKSRYDLIAHVKEIGAVRIELVCPQMRAGIGINELGIHSQLVASLLLAPLQDVAYAEVSADLLYVNGLALVGEGCAAGDDEAMGNA